LGHGAGIQEREAARQIKSYLIQSTFQHQPWSIGGAHSYISEHFMKEESHFMGRET